MSGSPAIIIHTADGTRGVPAIGHGARMPAHTGLARATTVVATTTAIGAGK